MEDTKRLEEELRQSRSRVTNRNEFSHLPAAGHGTDLSASKFHPGFHVPKFPGAPEERRGQLTSLTSSETLGTTSIMPGPFRRRGRLLELPILLNHEPFVALPDTGASCNMITYAAVDHLGIKLDNASDRQRFTVGSGESITSIGKVKIACSFMDLPEKPTIEEFSVVNKLVD